MSATLTAPVAVLDAGPAPPTKDHMLTRTALLTAAQASNPDEELSKVLGQGLTATDFITAGVIFVAALVAARILQTLISRALSRQDTEATVVRFVSRSIRNLVILGGLVYALVTLEVRMGPLLGAVGIGGLAIAFAAQSILENAFASILLRTRRPFRRGDQIATGDFDGTVEDVNFRTVVLRTYAGERVLLPCAQVLGDAIVNHSVNGVRRTTLEVGVAYRSDLVAVQRILLDAAAADEGVRRVPPPEAWVHEFGDSSINFALRYWHDPDIATLWRVRSSVAMAVKASFDAHGIEIPFPQRVVGFASPLAVDAGGVAAVDDGPDQAASGAGSDRGTTDEAASTQGEGR